MRLLITGIVLLVIATLSGCATITTGTSQSVTVITEKDVNGARCELTDSKGGKWYVNETPGTASVRKGDGPMSIICSKDGFKAATLSVDETVSGATFGNILIGGGIGIFIDAMSGSAQRYPDQIVLWMEPTEWASDEERIAWEVHKENYEAKIRAEQEALKEAQNNQAPFGS